MTTEQQLSDLMDFGRVIHVDDQGGARGAEQMRPGYGTAQPDEIQYVDLDEHGGAPDPEAPAGWEYLTGYTGQYGYRGNTMHPSEIIGGRLADDILATPGYYVAVVIDAWPEVEDAESESIGWGILRRL